MIAHRGLALGVAENTLGAFRAALAAGATHLESDAHATADGIAVLVHDEDLVRVAGVDGHVADQTLAQLQAIPLEGRERIPTLAEFLEAFPEARLNLDVKSEAAAAPVAAVIREAGAQDRVLVASFGSRRRKRALRLLGRPAPTSASVTQILVAVPAAKLGLLPLARLALRSVHAVQLPLRTAGIRIDTARMIRRLQSCGVEVHFWTINDPEEMQRLLALGADGIITDRVDLAVNLLG